jgi:hypothetical protein
MVNPPLVRITQSVRPIVSFLSPFFLSFCPSFGYWCTVPAQNPPRGPTRNASFNGSVPSICSETHLYRWLLFLPAA